MFLHRVMVHSYGSESSMLTHCQVISQLPNDATAKIAKQELENNWRGKNVELKIDKSLNLGEGYNIYARPAQQGDDISTKQLSPPAILSVCSMVLRS